MAAREASAVAAIARFDQDSGAALLPYTALLLRSESSASSRIERLTSSARKVIEEESFGGIGGNARAVVANTRAMREALAHDGALSTGSLLRMHEALLRPHAPDVAGRLRDEPIWIGGGEHAPVDALFVPPVHTRVPGALDDLIAFTVRTDLPPLTRAAIAHAQLETIHPFADGNGRTGRALIHVLLRQSGLGVYAPLPISAVLLADTSTYFHALDAYREGRCEAVIDLVVDAAQEAADLGLRAGTSLRAVHEHWETLITSRTGTPDRSIVRLLLSQPVLDVATTARELGVSEQAARRAFSRLESAGVVVGYQVARGRRAWRAPDVLDLMDDVTAGLRRPREPCPAGGARATAARGR
ncbi:MULTISPECIES: Fic family protein [Actinomyces]|uniref:Fic family protein n=1 Tax=Actinomyces respiraculi TaxID=2744574 RepID=A0A7T0LIY6_9ACTO|nr:MULTISPECIES: Fic family protein [Actinomyces]QPL04609.1 Fic family protein [Actinomyces respiraculi]